MECTCHGYQSDNFSQQCTCELGMAVVPAQTWTTVYEPEEALKKGTIFPELDLPFYKGGDANAH